MAAPVNSDSSDSEDRDFRDIINESGSESEFEGFDIEDLVLNARVQATIPIEQSDKDRENAIDSANNWSRHDTPPTTAPFTGEPGLKYELPDENTPLDFTQWYIKT